MKMANISLFLQGAREVILNGEFRQMHLRSRSVLTSTFFILCIPSIQLGLLSSDLFQTVDLYEAKDMGAVSEA